jgi:S1-C subfamily serine protease
MAFLTPKKKSRIKIITMLLSCLVLSISGTNYLTAQSASPQMTIPEIVRAANGAVVLIVMSNKDGQVLSQGSGFVISEDGLIVTNYHVIGDGSSAIVKRPDGAFFLVDGIVASDKARDVAVIKAHGESFRALKLGDSGRLEVGEEVVAIGNPLSLESTVSNGIISGFRTVEELGGKFLQVTTPISPGSSGGPLFNMAGEVVGITTFYLKGGENLNFAIPINDVKRIVSDKFSTIQPFPDSKMVSARSTNPTSPSVSVKMRRTASHMTYSSEDVAIAVFDSVVDYLRMKNVNLASAGSNSEYSLYLTVDRPIMKWLKVDIEARNADGVLLWRGKAESGGGLTGAHGLRVTEERIQKLLAAKIGIESGLPLRPKTVFPQ